MIPTVAVFLLTSGACSVLYRRRLGERRGTRTFCIDQGCTPQQEPAPDVRSSIDTCRETVDTELDDGNVNSARSLRVPLSQISATESSTSYPFTEYSYSTIPPPYESHGDDLRLYIESRSTSSQHLSDIGPRELSMPGAGLEGKERELDLAGVCL